MSGGLVFFAGQCPWAVSGRVWQLFRAAVAVGAVYTDAEKFLFLIRSEAFDYTKWQRDYFDAMSPDEIDKAVDRFSAENEFNGKKRLQ